MVLNEDAPRRISVLNGILWVLRTGAPWHDLPKRYTPYQTCHRRFQRWIEERGGLDLSECFIDGTFVGAKKGRMRGKVQAGTRYEDHGAGRPLWSSSLRVRDER